MPKQVYDYIEQAIADFDWNKSEVMHEICMFGYIYVVSKIHRIYIEEGLYA
jgi:hypothetical protein